MSPKAGQLLVNIIVPIITRAIARGTARAVGAEDREELTAECIAQAARILDAGEARGKELPAPTVVYHALQRTKYGQRGGNKSVTDVMAPRTQFKGRSTLISMDELLVDKGCDAEELNTLHDILAGRNEDAASQAARRIDWAEATRGMDALSVDIICSMADGRFDRETAEAHGLTVSRVRQLKRGIKSHIRSQWDRSMIGEAAQEPLWKRQVRASRERRACRVGSPAAQLERR